MSRESILQEGRKGYLLENLDDFFSNNEDSPCLPGEIIGIISKIDVFVEGILQPLVIKIDEVKEFFSTHINGSKINLDVQILKSQHSTNPHLSILNEKKGQLVYNPIHKQGRLVIS
ncbi:hypothetical protein EOL94_02060 [bacterium]|nr:hypothetical protein [bacterium]